MTETKPSVYNLYLQTTDNDLGGFQPPAQATDKTNKANVTWSMNWNEFFRSNNINGKYKYCRVRHQFTSAESLSYYIDPSSNVIPLVANDYLGYISCNLQTNNSLSATQNGSVLGFFYPRLVTAPFDNTNWYYNNSTLDEKGVDVVIPTGSQPFTISFYNYATNQLINFRSTEWQILMTFELYN